MYTVNTKKLVKTGFTLKIKVTTKLERASIIRSHTTKHVGR